MPLGLFFGILFFVLLAIAALTSAISLLEVVTAWLIDEKGWPRKKASVLMGLVIFITGIPPALGYSAWSVFSFPGLGTDILDTYDWFANCIFLPLGGVLAAIFTGYFWGTQKAVEEANKGNSGLTVGKTWIFLIRYIVPLLIAVILIMGIYDSFVK
jgi:NSS family neurotransmitter:Na+ symporter